MPIPANEKEGLDFGAEGNAPVTGEEAQAEQIQQIAQNQERTLIAMEMVAFSLRYYMEKTFPDFKNEFDEAFPEEEDPEGELEP
jgi:hypothetical protein